MADAGKTKAAPKDMPNGEWAGLLGQESKRKRASAMAALRRLPPERLNEPGKYGRSLLVELAMRRNGEAVEELLKMGADPNLACDDGFTPLLYLSGTACKTESRLKEGAKWLESSEAIAVVERLLESGANPNRLNKYKMGPLGAAVMYGNFLVAETLLKWHAADIYAQDQEALDALAAAVEKIKDPDFKSRAEKFLIARVIPAAGQAKAPAPRL